MEQNNNQFDQEDMKEFEDYDGSMWGEMYGSEHFNEDKIMKILLDYINEKIEDLYYFVQDDLKGFEIQMFKIENKSESQIGFKIERTYYELIDYPDNYMPLDKIVMLLDVNVYEEVIAVKLYDMKNTPDQRILEYTNGRMGSVDGIPIPEQENCLEKQEIESLFDEITDALIMISKESKYLK